jgi:DNA invertase Pin-like site-specific DNA recombinase
MTRREVQRVAGYMRVSTEDQAASGAGLAAQRTAIEAEARRRGWQLQMYEDRAASGKSLEHRPQLSDALAALRAHAADALVVGKLDRLTRSVKDFAELLERSTREGWALIVLDMDVDTSTPVGEAMANVFATFAQFERRLIGQRTREALQARRAQGVQLGRPPAIDKKTEAYIVQRHRAGATFQSIADALNRRKVPTPHGGALWRPSALQRVVRRTPAG